MNQNKINSKPSSANGFNKPLLIFICAFLSLVLVFFAVFGIVIAVRNSKALVKYNGTTLDEELSLFFCGYYKYHYMSNLASSGVSGVVDSPVFWNKKSESGKTYGELLLENTESYLKALIAANYIFDSVARLGSDDKKKIETTMNDLLVYQADGDKDLFNERAEKLGFDYKTVKRAAEIIYKASYAKVLLYGEDGSEISNYPDICESYLKTYSHVKLLIIRTETDFLLDENGNRIIGEDGRDKTYLLSTAEQEKRKALISEIRERIAAISLNGDVQMSPAMFDKYITEHDDGDEDMHSDGYYFNENSSYTAEFASAFPKIVDASYALKIGEYAEVELDFGVCFIYKYEPNYAAYLKATLSGCFSDFYSDAAGYVFERDIEEISLEVEFSEKFFDIDLINLEYDNTLFPKI